MLSDDMYWKIVYERLLCKVSVDVSEITELYENREQLKKELLDGEYKFSIPKKILVDKANGKKRVVYLFNTKDRLIIGVLYRVINTFFCNNLSENCFSYKSKTTTLDAIKYLKHDKHLSTKYCMKVDISHYFNSVNKEHIYNTLNTLFRGYENTLAYKYIFDIYSLDRCIYEDEIITEFMSLIPGTAVSNLLGNYCLKDVDNYFKDNNISYARYSDDIIMFGESENELNNYLTKLRGMIKDYGLEIKTSKCRVYKPHEFVTFLGLKFNDTIIDLSRESVTKLKKKIKKLCKEGRRKIVKGFAYEDIATTIINRINYFMYTCYIKDSTKFGWAYYAFRYINTDESIRELDFYLRDTLRWLKTGKYNSANIKKTTDTQLHDMGYRSIVMMYKAFKTDFDVYCSMVDLIKQI